MQLVKIVKKVNTKIDQAKAVISVFCLLSDIKLSDSELTVLSYFLVYGASEDTDNRIVQSGILTENSLNNVKSKLKRFGLIKKDNNKNYVVNEKISVKVGQEIGLLIKVENK